MAKTLSDLEAGPSSVPRRMSFEAFLDWEPGDDRHYEWVDGEAIQMAAVTATHVFVREFLATMMRAHVDYHRLGRILGDPYVMRLATQKRGRAPDILFLSKNNPAPSIERFLEGPADVVVEVISPGSSTTDRRHKFVEYERGGVPEYWIIDPRRERAHFHHLNNEGAYEEMPLDANGRFHSIALPGFWLNLDWLWEDTSIFDVMKEWGFI